MKLIDVLIFRYKRFFEKIKRDVKKKRLLNKLKRQKYFLDNYGVYNNADELTRSELLEVFWKILSFYDYDVRDFNAESSIDKPLEQSWHWGDFGDFDFIIEIGNIFGFSDTVITEEEYAKTQTFGELADLIIKKAKERKLKEHEKQN